MQEHVQALIAQPLCHCHRKLVRRLALVHQINIGGDPRCLKCVFLEQCQQPLHAHGKTASRCWLAANLLDQAVVTATRAHRTLCTELGGYPFEYSKVVIIQPTHQTRVDLVFDTGIAQHHL